MSADPLTRGPGTSGHEPQRPEELYLDLLKRVLTRTGFPSSFRILPTGRQLRHVPRRAIQAVLRSRGLRLVLEPDPELRENGKDWPTDGETMIGMRRLDNLQHCITDVASMGVSGDLIETGVWRGGSVIFMRAVLKAYGITDRVVWAADSFQGLPRPRPEQYGHDAGDMLWSYDAAAVGLQEVKENFRRYGLLDAQVRFLPGWFRDTLASAPIERLAVLRLDGDMYESTIAALEALYPKLSRGGYVIVDDYNAVIGCRQAVDDYRRARGIAEPLEDIDESSVFWQREAEPPVSPHS